MIVLHKYRILRMYEVSAEKKFWGARRVNSHVLDYHWTASSHFSTASAGRLVRSRERSGYSLRENPIKSAYFDTTRSRPPPPSLYLQSQWLHRMSSCAKGLGQSFVLFYKTASRSSWWTRGNLIGSSIASSIVFDLSIKSWSSAF